MNVLCILGNLTRDPELRFTPQNLAVCKFTIAHNDRRGDREVVTFLDCTVFGKQAEAFQKWHSRGSRALLQGRLQLETWESKDGSGKRSKHSMIVDQWSFPGSKADNAPRQPERGAQDSWADPLPAARPQDFLDDPANDDNTPF